MLRKSFIEFESIHSNYKKKSFFIYGFLRVLLNQI